MARRVSMSKAKRLTESLRAKTRRFLESFDSITWFEKELKGLKPSKLSVSDAIEELSEFEGSAEGIKKVFKPSDILLIIAGYYKELDKLEDVLLKERYKSFGYEDTTVFLDVNVGNYTTPVVISKAKDNSWALVIKSN